MRDEPICKNCAHWGMMGKCNRQSGNHSFGGIRFHQLVTTEPRDTCAEFANKDTKHDR